MPCGGDPEAEADGGDQGSPSVPLQGTEPSGPGIVCCELQRKAWPCWSSLSAAALLKHKGQEAIGNMVLHLQRSVEAFVQTEILPFVQCNNPQ